MTVKSPRTLHVCNCQGTMSIDAARLSTALGYDKTLPLHKELCRSGIQAFQDALAKGEPMHIACTQEAPLFREIAEDAGHDPDQLVFTNIRERAGWCASPKDALPKMAALLAEATYEAKPAGLLNLTSNGMCLVYGAGQVALEAAQTLAGELSVTLVLTDAADAIPPERGEVAIYKGRLHRLSGHLGAFDVVVDAYAAMLPFSRSGFEFAMPRDGARSTCDLVLDLSGGPALLSEPDRRDGYLRADPTQPLAVAKAVRDISELVGEFEKPLYVAYDASICAHARSGKTGCSNCIDVCPMGAITPDGDNVLIDHMACAGCGNCSAACPTGAVSHMLPARDDLIGRARVLLETYARAGGKSPVLLVHSDVHGGALISAMARFGRGLPPHVLPMQTGAVTALGHDTLASLLAGGVDHIVLLGAPERAAEMTALEAQIDLLHQVLGGLGHVTTRVHLALERDPDAVETLLWELAQPGPVARTSLPRHTSKRELAGLAFAAFHDASASKPDTISLPSGAPYGRLLVEDAKCTLCLSCVGACPANALSDHPDRPELAFTEAACVQCGVCVATCPESAIKLEPRYDFTTARLNARVIKTEEPFSCVSCGTPFGARSSIERVVERLKGHSMFQNEAQIRLIQMCDNCRVTTLSQDGGDPYKVGQRPRIRTTDDYVEAEKAAKRTGRKLEDFLDD